MKNTINLLAGLSLLGLTACNNCCPEPQPVVVEQVQPTEVIMMHPESAVHPEHHKKHHAGKHHVKHPRAHDCDRDHKGVAHPKAAHKAPAHKDAAKSDMSKEMPTETSEGK